ncbi:phage head closure protein [Peptostreptococcus sp. D1]|uniref:phage head closure protein n=1 Tax=Peptostreptococcus sp. D1 TaxID=72304 RepID=UPI0015A4F651|nr:phage head closure protein [Peptostreptococcus sp. D1]
MDRRIEIYKKNIVGGIVKTKGNDVIENTNEIRCKRNELGEVIGEYSDDENELSENIQGLKLYKRVWANVVPMKSSEKVDKTGTIVGDDLYKINIRYLRGINRKCVIKYQGLEYEIESVQEVDRRRYLEIICKRSKYE